MQLAPTDCNGALFGAFRRARCHSVPPHSVPTRKTPGAVLFPPALPAQISSLYNGLNHRANRPAAQRALVFWARSPYNRHA